MKDTQEIKNIPIVDITLRKFNKGEFNYFDWKKSLIDAFAIGIDGEYNFQRGLNMFILRIESALDRYGKGEANAILELPWLQVEQETVSVLWFESNCKSYVYI